MFDGCHVGVVFNLFLKLYLLDLAQLNLLATSATAILTCNIAMARSHSVVDNRGISKTALLVTEQNQTAVSCWQDFELPI